MMRCFKYIAGSLLAVLMMTMASCEHKDLYMVDSKLVKLWVDFDYSRMPSQASAMRVLFYPITGRTTGAPYVFDVSGTGGYVNVPEGDFKVLAYNVDNENIIEVGESEFPNFMLTTVSTEVETRDVPSSERTASFSRTMTLFGQALPRSDEEDDFLLYDEPDYTCRCFTEFFHVDQTISVISGPDGTTGKEAVATTPLTMTAEPATCTLEFDIKGIEGVQRANYVRATLSGISASYLMSEGRATAEKGMVAFECKIDKDNNLIHGRVYLWGYKPYGDSDTRQFLNIYIWASGGNFYSINDITDILTEAVDQEEQSKYFNFDITIDLDITQGVVGNSGFVPSIGEWDEETHDIAL